MASFDERRGPQVTRGAQDTDPQPAGAVVVGIAGDIAGRHNPGCHTPWTAS